MKTLSILLATSFLVSTSCLAQEPGPLTTDRPTTGVGPELVPAHSLETETGIGWTDDDHRSRFDLPESLVRYGVTEWFEPRILLPNAHLFGGEAAQSDDIQIGAKIRLRSAEGPWPMSFTTALSAPTGTHGLSSGGWDPYETFSISRELPRNFFAFSSITFASVSGAPDGRRFFTQGALDFGYLFAPQHKVYVEYAPLYDGRQSSTGYIVDAGTLWTVRRNVMLDLRVGESVVGGSSSLNVSIGYSVRRFLRPAPLSVAAR